MKLKLKFCIGMTAIAICCYALVMPAFSSPALESDTQTLEEIENIKASNEEYELTHPRPSAPATALNVSFVEISADRKQTSIQTHSFNEEPPIVYLEPDCKVYHTGSCSYYKSKAGDYSQPRWLTDVVTSEIRCSECISDETYSLYRYAVCLSLQNRQTHTIIMLSLIILILVLFMILHGIRSLIKKKKRTRYIP